MVGDTEWIHFWCEAFNSRFQRTWYDLGGNSCQQDLSSVLSIKQCHEQFVTPESCFPQPVCSFSAFRTPVLRRFLLDPDSCICGGVASLGEFSLFNKVADIIAPQLGVIFWGPIRRGSFPMCYLSAFDTAIPKGALSPENQNRRIILISHILSKVFV